MTLKNQYDYEEKYTPSYLGILQKHNHTIEKQYFSNTAELLKLDPKEYRDAVSENVRQGDFQFKYNNEKFNVDFKVFFKGNVFISEEVGLALYYQMYEYIDLYSVEENKIYRYKSSRIHAYCEKLSETVPAQKAKDLNKNSISPSKGWYIKLKDLRLPNKTFE